MQTLNSDETQCDTAILDREELFLKLENEEIIARENFFTLFQKVFFLLY